MVRTNGSFVYTGFKPAWILMAKTNLDATGNVEFKWDNARTPI